MTHLPFSTMREAWASFEAALEPESGELDIRPVLQSTFLAGAIALANLLKTGTPEEIAGLIGEITAMIAELKR